MNELPKNVLKLIVEPGDIIRSKKIQTTETYMPSMLILNL